MKPVLYQLLFLSFIISSCNGNRSSQNSVPTDDLQEVYVVQYAKGFSVNKYTDYTQITVRNPWDTTRVLKSYILVEKGLDLPAHLPDGILVRTPLSKIVAYSTIHCSTFRELNSLPIITGVCESSYIDIPYIRDGVKNGTIVDLGESSSPNIEKTILLQPEALFSTPIEGMSYGGIEKMGLTMIETPDYMEASPLGRAEWIRFYSLFVGQEALADSLFAVTVNNYNEVKEQISQTTIRPTVFLDTKYANIWYIAGGRSYMANMMKDAGAKYIWADDVNTGFVPLASETVLDKANKANFWLIKYNSPNPLTYTSLAKENILYTYFDAFKNRSVYECNTRTQSYYEDLPIHPDKILKDFAAIFHPELFVDYQARYYKKMQE